MASNKNDKNQFGDFIVSSIGACVAVPSNKKKPCVMLAYMSGVEKNISILLMDMPPKKKMYDKNDFLDAIKDVEDVRNITYYNSDGKPKDIYFCRANTGKIVDVVDRDYEKNRFSEGFGEIYTAPLRFDIDNIEDVDWKIGKKINLKISGTTSVRYDIDSYEYAAINAYNACLLGNVFEREELQLETKDGKRVRVEVKLTQNVYIDDNVLTVTPVLNGADGALDHYLTEEFNFIDGEDIWTRAYKIAYTNRLGDYNLVRV